MRNLVSGIKPIQSDVNRRSGLVSGTEVEMRGVNASRRPLNAADEELAEYFTAAIGVRAQTYDVLGSTTPDPHAPRIAQLGRVQRVDAVAATVARLPVQHRRVIVLVYGAGAGVLEAGAERGITDVDVRLALALQPKTGFGSFVWLATTLDKARDAYAKHTRKMGAASQPSVLSFLRSEAIERPGESTSFFASLKAECVRLQAAALEAYEPLRVERVEAEGLTAKQAREARTRARERLLEEELDIDRSIRRARFQRRLRRTA